MTEWLKGIDERAVVHPEAEIDEGVTIGPFSIIGPGVRIGARSSISAHVVIDGDVTIGSENRVYPYSVIGLPPQDLKYDGETTKVIIGDRNTIREYTQVHRGTAGGGGETRIGNDCYFMVSSHVAHDCIVRDHVLFANAATLAGHVEVCEHATVGAYSGVHQFCRVGPHAFIGGYSLITRDALPYCLTAGNRASCFGLNKIGLKRKGFSRETLDRLDRALRRIFRNDAKRDDAIANVEKEMGDVPEVRMVIEFIRRTKRGVVPIRATASE